MKILSIETSCDDTAIAIVKITGEKTPVFTVLSNIVSSQIMLHKEYGGVFPSMAKREHQKNITTVTIKALSDANLLKEKKQPLSKQQDLVLQEMLEKEKGLYEFVKELFENYDKPDINAIAVTRGPGLEPCLWVGVNFAKALSYIWDLPVIPVNHIEGHILVNFLQHNNIQFPALSLIVSGGHTQLILVKNIGEYEIIGETQDDAAGECFDKAARLLGLEYPGGPIISRIASTIQASDIALPRPMIHSKDYNFSFSGLKTSVLYKLRDTAEEITKSKGFIEHMCFAVQDAICDVLVKKTFAAAEKYQIKTIILGGGVSANKELRKQFNEKGKEDNIHILIPDAAFSTDNGVMIGVTAFFHQDTTVDWQNLTADGNLRIGA